MVKYVKGNIPESQAEVLINKEPLQKQSQKKNTGLTNARALLLYALYAFESAGEHSSLFAANKLAYFLQRMGQNLNLHFKKHHYGPYAIGVQKVLYALNGVYLKGLEQGQAQAFEPLYLNYEKFDEVKQYINTRLSNEETDRLNHLLHFLDGFTSELSLEILATVDFILSKNPDYNFEEVMSAISRWNLRKKDLFKEEYVKIAFEHWQRFNQEFLQT